MKKMNKTYEAPVVEVVELNVSNPYMQTGTLTGSGAVEDEG